MNNMETSVPERKLQLHYWVIREFEEMGKKYIIGYGRVSGHPKLKDTDYISTSAVKSISVDYTAEELLLETRNSLYHCPLAYCNFEKQDRFADLIPDYSAVKEKYGGKGYPRPTTEPGKILLVLANFCAYYFHSLYYVPADGESLDPLEYHGRPHVGTFCDSFLVGTNDMKIDLRYFPHFQNISFYHYDTDGKPVYIENIGDVILYARTMSGIIKLEPGERKEVCEANTEKEVPYLPEGDLYPAGTITN